MTEDPRTTFVPEEADRSAADRERLLARTFLRLADTLVEDFDVVDFLQGLSTDSVSILDAAAAGVMLDDGRGGLRLVASSEERMRLLELFELQTEQGPVSTCSVPERRIRRTRQRAGGGGPVSRALQGTSVST